MPAYLLPADKLTHLALGLCIALVLLPFAWQLAALGCLVVAIGREVYGWHKRGRTMTRADAIEHGKDIVSTLAGGGAVLAAAFIGV